MSGATCSATEYCAYPDNSCGIADQTGVCAPRPTACPQSAAVITTPVCACDGKIYDSACAAIQAGVDLDAHGGCAIAAGKFACGYTQCTLATEYCLHLPHATGSDFSCSALPAACSGNETCSCLASESCGNACTGGSGGLTLTCPSS